MKDLFAGLIALLIVLALVGGIFSLGIWVVTGMLNVFLGQLGLGAINMWGTLCLTVSMAIIYKFITW